jgi:glucose uptake protein GlcU
LISLKYLGDYPLDGFYVTQFITSFIFVWSVGFTLDGPALLGNIRQVYATDPSRVVVTLVCGVMYVIGMRLSLFVVKTIGLSLSQPIGSSVNILGGTLVAALVGGVPARLSPLKIALVVILLVGAVTASMVSGNLHTKNREQSEYKSGSNYTMKDLWRALGLALFAAAFIPAYTIGISYGLHSITQPNGLAVLPFTGAMLGSGLLLTINKQWSVFFHAPMSVHKFGIISGLFHYGGNIIHTFATASLSSVVSWPLGITASLWTQLWGLAYGELRGAPRKAYVALFIGIVLYLLGPYVIAFK